MAAPASQLLRIGKHQPDHDPLWEHRHVFHCGMTASHLGHSDGKAVSHTTAGMYRGDWFPLTPAPSICSRCTSSVRSDPAHSAVSPHQASQSLSRKCDHQARGIMPCVLPTSEWRRALPVAQRSALVSLIFLVPPHKRADDGDFHPGAMAAISEKPRPAAADQLHCCVQRTGATLRHVVSGWHIKLCQPGPLPATRRRNRGSVASHPFGIVRRRYSAAPLSGARLPTKHAASTIVSRASRKRLSLRSLLTGA